MLSVERLAEFFETPDLTEDARREVHTNVGRAADSVCDILGHSFLLEWKTAGSLGNVSNGISRLREALKGFPDGTIPLLAVPYMGQGGQAECARAQICWLDLSGNARIVVPGFFYQNLGNRNLFRRRGRPESAFGPRGSRITRRLLTRPSETLTQRTLASSTGLDEGHTSRIVGKLLESGLIERGEHGISVVDPNGLLDAWRDDYRFDRHHVIEGYIPASGGETLIRGLAEALSNAGEPYAATALPAAWLWTEHTPSISPLHRICFKASVGKVKE